MRLSEKIQMYADNAVLTINSHYIVQEVKKLENIIKKEREVIFRKKKLTK